MTVYTNMLVMLEHQAPEIKRPLHWSFYKNTISSATDGLLTHMILRCKMQNCPLPGVLLIYDLEPVSHLHKELSPEFCLQYRFSFLFGFFDRSII